MVTRQNRGDLIEIEGYDGEVIYRFEKGDRVCVHDYGAMYVLADPDVPFVLGEIVGPGTGKKILVLLDGLETPLSFFASELQVIHIGDQPYGLDFRRRPAWRRVLSALSSRLRATPIDHLSGVEEAR